MTIKTFLQVIEEETEIAQLMEEAHFILDTRKQREPMSVYSSLFTARNLLNAAWDLLNEKLMTEETPCQE